MNQFRQYVLDFQKTLTYLQDNLEGTNSLSSAVCNFVNFEQGNFYTILRHDIEPDHLHAFKAGGIKGNFKKKVFDLVFEELQTEENFIAVFDDVDATYTPSYEWFLYSDIGVHHNEEVYYTLSKEKASKKIIEEAFNASNAIWHSLCVVSASSIPLNQGQSLPYLFFAEIAKNASLIVLSAYDEEGFIFWEKEKS